MADLTVLRCDLCGFEVDTWDEGNPYYLDDEGCKHYAYSPSPEKGICTENDVPHLCLDCGEVFDVDTRRPLKVAPCCGSLRFLPTMAVLGCACPKCRAGTLKVGQRYWLEGRAPAGRA